MRQRKWREALAYGVAVGSVLLALTPKLLFGTDWTGTDSLFFAAVMVSAWFGGIGPGLVATALAAAATTYFFLEPTGSLHVDVEDFVRTAVFIAVAILISSLHARTKQSEQAMLRAKEEAVAANLAKDRFLAVVSHELRNPLNPVLTLASVWQEDPSLPEEARQDMEMIRRNVELEARLIEDLLDISRITAGKLSLRRQGVDVTHVIRDAVAVCQDEAQEKGLTIEVQTPAQQTSLEGDPARLRQVVWNLLRNAVKFTPAAGTITVRAGNPSPCELEIAVIDTGIGIDPAALERIFDAFDQGTAEVPKHYGGLGLGLAIARALVQAHGGTIAAHSEGAGRGARFVVRLPLPAGRSGEGAQRPADAPAIIATATQQEVR